MGACLAPGLSVAFWGRGPGAVWVCGPGAARVARIPLVLGVVPSSGAGRGGGGPGGRGGRVGGAGRGGDVGRNGDVRRGRRGMDARERGGAGGCRGTCRGSGVRGPRAGSVWRAREPPASIPLLPHVCQENSFAGLGVASVTCGVRGCALLLLFPFLFFFISFLEVAQVIFFFFKR